MSIHWLIATFLLLSNQFPTSLSQNDCHPDCFCSETNDVICTFTSSSVGLPAGIPSTTIHMSITCRPSVRITPQRQMFVSFTSLQTLQVYHCFNVSSPELGMFAGLSTLTQLSIEHNIISSLVPGVFSDLESLETLRLVNNSIRQIQFGTFQGLTNAQHIVLENNTLASVDVSVFDGLADNLNVLFKGNPMVCDCNLHPLWQRFSDVFGNSDTRCADGNDLANRTWGELNDTALCPDYVPPLPTASDDPVTNEPVTENTIAEEVGGSNIALIIALVAVGALPVLIVLAFIVYRLRIKNSEKTVGKLPDFPNSVEPVKK